MLERPHTLIRSLLTWSTLRYAISGTIVGVFSLAMPVLLNAEFGVALEVCIPIIYVLSAMLQFSLQRLFVFRHIEKFALPMHRQGLWYVAIAAFQYPVSALSTAFLPSLLGVPARAVYVVATLAVALLTLLFLRTNVFHELELVTGLEAAEGELPCEGLTTSEKAAVIRLETALPSASDLRVAQERVLELLDTSRVRTASGSLPDAAGSES
jgi:hypothetical protein